MAAKTLEVFADVTCPFTHVGLRRLVEARRERGVLTNIRVRAWPLEWINGAPLAADLLRREVEALRSGVAPDLFAGFDPTICVRSSMPAFGLAAAAYATNDEVGEAVSLAVRDAFFESGRDVSDEQVVREIGARFDVEPLDALATAAAVKRDWERGKVRGVAGSPHFVIGKRDWFCPSLRIRHDDTGFRIEPAEDSMREFYASAFG